MILHHVESLVDLVFPPDTVNPGDIKRWLDEPFCLNKCWLVQRNGGPCGVLSAVQAYLMAYLLFEDKETIFPRDCLLSEIESSSETKVQNALVEAMVSILWQAADDGAREISICTYSNLIPRKDGGEIHYECTRNKEEAKAFFLSCLSQYSQPGGVMLFLYSLVLTRTVKGVLDDMDDIAEGLTGEHGQCTQELMNLMLLGYASSQVHDGKMDLGDGMMLRGVFKRSKIGYLSYLEALRYCQVGMFYKKPIYPIWVIGSSSHYTVLFGKDENINEETEYTKKRNRALRAFREQDRQENGFVAISNIPAVLDKLDFSLDTKNINQFISACEMHGSGIVLWRDFWQTMLSVLYLPAVDWNCRKCTYLNTKDRKTCEICGESISGVSIDDEYGDEDDDDNPQTFQFTHVNGLIFPGSGSGKEPSKVTFDLTTVSKVFQAPSKCEQGIPLEEVLQTRWPGCVFVWPNNKVPSID